MLSLLYVSRNIIPDSQWSAALADIHSLSLSNNSILDVTGLLIATPDWFGQLIEGEPEDVDRIMMAILADSRHQDVRIVRRVMVDRRRCSSWRLVRFDRGMFAASHLYPALERAHSGNSAEDLRSLDKLIDRLLSESNSSPKLHFT